MAVVLDATPAGAASNTYMLLADADAYHSERLHVTTWDNADADTKNRALVMATRMLDTMFVWDAFPTTEEQALQWPRSGVLAANQLEYVGDYEIPRELKWATAEYARLLIESDTTRQSDAAVQGITSLSAGSVSISFKDGITTQPVPDSVGFLLPSWWYTIRGKQSGIRPLVRA